MSEPVGAGRLFYIPQSVWNLFLCTNTFLVQRSKSNWPPAAVMPVRAKNSTTGAGPTPAKSRCVCMRPLRLPRCYGEHSQDDAVDWAWYLPKHTASAYCSCLPPNATGTVAQPASYSELFGGSQTLTNRVLQHTAVSCGFQLSRNIPNNCTGADSDRRCDNLARKVSQCAVYSV